MALTITPNPTYGNDVWGSVEVRFVNAVPAAADYVTGGYTITPGAGLSLSTIYFVVPLGGQAGYVPVWNPSTTKLQVWVTGAAANAELNEVPASTDLSALTFELLIIGR